MLSALTRGLLVWICMWGAVGGLLRAQGGPEGPAGHDFLGLDRNYIGNHVRGMWHFYHQLSRLEAGRIRTINIVHIGDSHIQADWFSGETRRLLQRRFGSAGRGLVFPYALAKTNSPGDIHSYSNVSWEIDRIISSENYLPIGLSGITLRTHRPDFSLQLKVDDAPGLDYRFNKVTVLTGSDQDHFDLLASARPIELVQKYGSEKEVFPISLSSRSLNPFTSTVYLSDLTHQIHLQAQPNRNRQQQATFYGLVLENFNARGILYHTIGVNSAQYRHYARADVFAEQLQALRPDLVIISLGTNESVGYFSEERFFQQVDDLVHNIEQYMPHTAILFTTPPDAYYQGKTNAKVNLCREVLLRYAFNNDLSCWDLYEVMGGENSVDQWYHAGLAGRDRLHFTKAGYELQGKLLYEAILHGYDAYLSGR